MESRVSYMARFIPGVLGTPSGKSQNQVYRIVNGKPFVSNRPEKYNISQTKQAKNSRLSFGTIVQFAKTITSFPELAYCWKNAKIKGTSPYHRVLKHNLPLTQDGALTLRCQIIPKGFECIFNCELTEDRVFLFNFDITSSGLKASNFEVNAYTIVALFNTTAKKSELKLLSNSKSIITTGKPGEIKFSISFPDSEKKLINKHKKIIVYSAIIILKDGVLHKHSSSFAKELEI